MESVQDRFAQMSQDSAGLEDETLGPSKIPCCNQGEMEERSRTRSNALYSKHYRARRKWNMALLEREAHQLKHEIEATERNLSRLRKIFYDFVRHAADCATCGSVKIHFE